MVSKAQLKANIKYRKKALYSLTLAFNRKYDKEIVDKLLSVDNKADYIRQLVLKDLGGK